jgi:choline dehydrogenase
MSSRSARYDYIVVGGGTAGGVIAARLSADPAVSVLVLESGSETPLPEMAAPQAWPMLVGGPADWADAVRDVVSGRSIIWPRGRALGGSTSINAMMFVRGHRSSYDEWPGVGAPGWGFDELLPYFKRSERTAGKETGLRGESGPLPVSPAAHPNPVTASMLDAVGQAGFPAAKDISAGVEEGFGWHDLTIADGTRRSAADVYLRPVLGRPNLAVLTETTATRVLVDGGECTGVEYSVNGEVASAECVREVILTAGTIGSPRLLMLSGIGPAAHLRDVGVELVLDLPGVGENLHDHPVAEVIYEAGQPMPPSEYNHIEASGLIRADERSTRPDLQIGLCSIPLYIPPMSGPENGFSIWFSCMAPASRGTVRLASADPAAKPIVDPRCLTTGRDMQAMIAGLRTARKIGEAAALGPWRKREVFPGPEATTDADLETYIRGAYSFYAHGVGTCRIGTDAMAVVDPQLKLRGIGRLRVADASVMPSVVSGNTQAATYAIAERAASLIADDKPAPLSLRHSA